MRFKINTIAIPQGSKQKINEYKQIKKANELENPLDSPAGLCERV